MHVIIHCLFVYLVVTRTPYVQRSNGYGTWAKEQFPPVFLRNFLDDPSWLATESV